MYKHGCMNVHDNICVWMRFHSHTNMTRPATYVSLHTQCTTWTRQQPIIIFSCPGCEYIVSLHSSMCTYVATIGWSTMNWVFGNCLLAANILLAIHCFPGIARSIWKWLPIVLFYICQWIWRPETHGLWARQGPLLHHHCPANCECNSAWAHFRIWYRRIDSCTFLETLLPILAVYSACLRTLEMHALCSWQVYIACRWPWKGSREWIYLSCATLGDGRSGMEHGPMGEGENLPTLHDW